MEQIKNLKSLSKKLASISTDVKKQTLLKIAEKVERNKEKINWYLNHKILPGERILFLYENSRSGLDFILVRKQIEAFMAM